MRAIILLSLLSLSAAGCSTLTAPTPNNTIPNDLTSYFWPDSNATYVYRSDSDTHTVTVKRGGTITDVETSTISTSTWIVTRTASGNIVLAGLSSSDLFGLDPEIEIVSDTTSTSLQQAVLLHSVAATGDKVYAASDTTLYKIEAEQLTRVCPMPAAGLTLEEGRGCIYAVEFGGDKIYSTTNEGGSWTMFTTPAKGILAFVADDGGPRRHCWAAVGTSVFEFQDNLPVNVIRMSDTVVALAPGFGGDVLVGQVNGQVFGVYGSIPQLVYSLGPGQTLQCLSRNYVGSTAGVYDYQVSGFPKLVGSVSTLYDGEDGTYVGMSDGRVFRLDNSFAHRVVSLRMKGDSGITQFATFTSGQHQAPSVFVLSGSMLFHQIPGGWDTVQRTWSITNPLKPGGFTLLAPSASGWQAALFEEGKAGGSIALSDQARYVTQANDIVLEGVPYHDVIMVRYTAFRGTQADITSTPEYLIYYQRNVGPIRIERTENGQTTVTRLVK
jgi:hypothetical protein